jgi:hypothetical protein
MKILSMLLLLVIASAVPIPPADSSHETGEGHESRHIVPTSKAIYGPDSREEHSVQSDEWKTIGDATAMILSISCAGLDDTLAPANNGQREVTYSTTLGSARGDCDGTAPFKDQLEPGCCSATLIAPNKIATAGHCIDQYGESRTRNDDPARPAC